MFSLVSRPLNCMSNNKINEYTFNLIKQRAACTLIYLGAIYPGALQTKAAIARCSRSNMLLIEYNMPRCRAPDKVWESHSISMSGFVHLIYLSTFFLLTDHMLVSVLGQCGVNCAQARSGDHDCKSGTNRWISSFLSLLIQSRLQWTHSLQCDVLISVCCIKIK